MNNMLVWKHSCSYASLNTYEIFAKIWNLILMIAKYIWHFCGYKIHDIYDKENYRGIEKGWYPCLRICLNIWNFLLILIFAEYLHIRNCFRYTIDLHIWGNFCIIECVVSSVCEFVCRNFKVGTRHWGGNKITPRAEHWAIPQHLSGQHRTSTRYVHTREAPPAITLVIAHRRVVGKKCLSTDLQSRSQLRSSHI